MGYSILFARVRELCFYGILFCLCIVFGNCSKSEFLSANPNQRLTVPKSLSDFRLLLEYSPVMNGFGVGLCPGLGEVYSDNYYINQSLFNSNLSSNDIYRKMYAWEDGIFIDPNYKPEDWGFPYRCISYCNIVLDGLSKLSINKEQIDEYNDIKGSALFFRAHMYYQLMQIFSPMYDVSTAKEMLGVPLKLDADISTPTPRAYIHDVYSQITHDLDLANNLLKVSQPNNARPSRVAVNALLSRVYLSMRDYASALKYSNACLNDYDELMDFNTISGDNLFPFSRENKEIIFYSLMSINMMELINLYYCRVDSNLYQSYADGDLRKKLFFLDAANYLGLSEDTGYFFRGSYEGTELLFAGIATDEIFFIRAESKVRTGDIDGGMEDLNTLMKTRWDNQVPFQEYTAINVDEALHLILGEKRKECLFRGIRWPDIRRLNKEGANISLNRKLNNIEYSLPVNSLKYTLLFPQEVIDANPGMPQNVR